VDFNFKFVILLSVFVFVTWVYYEDVSAFFPV